MPKWWASIVRLQYPTGGTVFLRYNTLPAWYCGNTRSAGMGRHGAVLLNCPDHYNGILTHRKAAPQGRCKIFKNFPQENGTWHRNPCHSIFELLFFYLFKSAFFVVDCSYLTNNMCQIQWAKPSSDDIEIEADAPPAGEQCKWRAGTVGHPVERLGRHTGTKLQPTLPNILKHALLKISLNSLVLSIFDLNV